MVAIGVVLVNLSILFPGDTDVDSEVARISDSDRSALNDNLTAIRDIIWKLNRRQSILNLDRFDLQASESTVVIVVQVHNRPEYLRHLVRSLSHAVDIEQTLLIFSHDYYSDELNDIIALIDFAPVILTLIAFICLHVFVCFVIYLFNL